MKPGPDGRTSPWSVVNPAAKGSAQQPLLVNDIGLAAPPATAVPNCDQRRFTRAGGLHGFCRPVLWATPRPGFVANKGGREAGKPERVAGGQEPGVVQVARHQGAADEMDDAGAHAAGTARGVWSTGAPGAIGADLLMSVALVRPPRPWPGPGLPAPRGVSGLPPASACRALRRQTDPFRPSSGARGRPRAVRWRPPSARTPAGRSPGRSPTSTSGSTAGRSRRHPRREPRRAPRPRQAPTSASSTDPLAAAPVNEDRRPPESRLHWFF